MSDDGERKAKLLSYIDQHGMPPVVDGPVIEHYDGQQLAKAIKHEIARAQGKGQTKIVLTMSLIDAYRLAEKLETT